MLINLNIAENDCEASIYSNWMKRFNLLDALVQLNYKMYKHTGVAYFLYIFGLYFGLHYIYLNQPLKAFFYTVTFGFYGLGYVYDMFYLPELVNQANKSPEYIDLIRTKQKYNKKPSIQIHVLLFQFISGVFGGVIGSCIPPSIFPPIVYLISGGIFSGCAIYYSGRALLVLTESSLLILLLVCPVVSCLCQINQHNVVYGIQNYYISSIVGILFFLYRRKWIVNMEELNKNETKAKNTFLNNQTGFIRNLFKYFLYMSIFISISGIGLFQYGKINIIDPFTGKEHDFYISEGFYNIYKSPVIQEATKTLYNIYAEFNGFYSSWEKLKETMDPTGKIRALRILEIDTDASNSDIKKAYKRLALKWHPDKFSGTSSEIEASKSKFLEIQKAYELLTSARS